MKQTRRLKITRKRFTRGDLLQIGKIFLDEAESARVNNERYSVEFDLRCVDGTSYSSDDMSHFEENAEIDIKSAAAVQFVFHNYKTKRYLDFNLSKASTRIVDLQFVERIGNG